MKVESPGIGRAGAFVMHACEASFQTDEKLRFHLQKIHNINVEYEELEFKSVVEKLEAGVSFTKVIDDVRGRKVVNALHRMKLIDMQDLQNILCDFTKIHENDAISVKLWVEEMETLGEENPVLLSKAQDESSGVLTENDFMLDTKL